MPFVQALDDRKLSINLSIKCTVPGTAEAP